MLKRITSKAVLLTALLATGATVMVQSAMAQNASSITLELFNAKPVESSQPTASLEIGVNGGDLKTIEAPDKAGKARYLRAKVSSGAGIENFVYRVIGNPNNGTLFVITPDSKVILLKKMLISTGLEVAKDKTVKLGAQTDFSGTKSAVTDTSVDASATATGSTAAATPTETATEPSATAAPTEPSTSATPADASAAAPPADASASTPATDSSTAPSTTPSITPADSSATTPADASATPAATDSSSTPAADAAATPTTDSSAAPASPSSMVDDNATPLTKPISTTVGQVEVNVIPSGTPAPASSEKNFILAPTTDAKEAKSSVDGNIVTLTYASKSSLEVVSKFYDDQLKAQGFTHDTASADNQQGASAFIKVYKRGNASIIMSVRAEQGEYMVEVDLEKLASGG